MNEKIKALAREYLRRSDIYSQRYVNQSNARAWKFYDDPCRDTSIRSALEDSRKAMNELRQAVLADESLTLGWKDGDRLYMASPFHNSDDKIQVESNDVELEVRVGWSDENKSDVYVFLVAVVDYNGRQEYYMTDKIYRTADEAARAMRESMQKALADPSHNIMENDSWSQSEQ